MRTRLKIFSLALLLAGCGTIAISLPPVSEQPTGVHNDGRVVWHDLLTTTPEASRKFYGELFGWTFERPQIHIGTSGDDDYMLIRHNGKLIGGMVDANAMRADVNISQWVTVISTGDIDAAVSRSTAGGASVLTEPTSVGARGTLAVIEGPTGALFAVVQTRDGDPPEASPAVNGFLWDEVWTDDVPVATEFYKDVFGFERTDHDIDDTDRTYHVFRNDGKPRAGLLAHPFENERSAWVNYVRVEDPAALAARVDSLGGRILVDAQPRPVGGTVALVAGPSGAAIALQTWPIEQEGE